MLKKKSYMNIKNIINEGIFSTTLEKLFKVLMSRKANKVLKKSKRFNNSLDDLNSSIDQLQNSINSELEDLGSKDKVKLKKFKSKDFLK